MLPLPMYCCFAHKWKPCPSLLLIQGLIHDLSTLSILVKVVTRPADTKHKKAAFIGNKIFNGYPIALNQEFIISMHILHYKFLLKHLAIPSFSWTLLIRDDKHPFAFLFSHKAFIACMSFN